MTELVGRFYYPLVVQDIDAVIDAIEYYKHVHAHGDRHNKLKGVIERMMLDQPGLMKIYEDAHTDAAMVRKWLDEKTKHLRAKKRLWYIKNPDAQVEYGDVKKTDSNLEMLVQADDEIQYYIELSLMVELWERSLGKLVGRLKDRGIYLSMITKLRIAGEREAYIDASHETDPETIG